MAVNARVQKHRDALRRAGLRPVQLWVPDTNRAGFVEECRRQCQQASAADMVDPGLYQVLDEALLDIDGDVWRCFWELPNKPLIPFLIKNMNNIAISPQGNRHGTTGIRGSPH